MARRLPRRGAGGRFLKGGGKRRRSSSRKRRRRNPSSSSSSPRRRRRRYRANPTAPKLSARGIMRQAVQGVQDAAWIVTGKAAARAVPTFLKLPREGVLGLGVQFASAIAAGWLAHSFAGRDPGRFVLAGGLTAPIETALVAYRVPFFAPALSPATAAQQVGAYRWPTAGMSAYANRPRLRAPATPAGVGAYANQGNGRGPINGDY